MEPSKRSVKPLRDADCKLAAISFKDVNFAFPKAVLSFSSTNTSVCFAAPLVFKNSRLKLAIVTPFHSITIRASSVTSATRYASKFSASAKAINLSTSSAATTTAIRSWDSLIAISVPSRPSYFLRTASKLILSPSANSPIATLTPPAPKSLQRLIKRVTSLLRNNLWIFLSSGALPFCTSEAMVARDFKL